MLGKILPIYLTDITDIAMLVSVPFMRNLAVGNLPKINHGHKSACPHEDFAENFQMSFMGFWENFLTWNFFFHAAGEEKEKKPF